MKPNVILLQALVKNRNAIRDGIFKIQDVVKDYYKMGGKNLEQNDTAILENFFVKEAPDNITSMSMAEDLIDIKPSPYNTEKKFSITELLNEQNPGKDFSGVKTMSEAMDVKEGISSLPEGQIARDDMATFIKNMRGEGLSNIDIAGVRKVPGDVQKQTAEMVVQYNRSGADTPIKKEFFDDFQQTKQDYGSRYFKEDYQGFDSYGDLVKNKSSQVRNAIADDLEVMGVPENDVTQILVSAREVADNNPGNPEAMLASIKQDLEISNINYDMRFWDNYFSDLLEASAKEPPMFRHGGLVSWE